MATNFRRADLRDHAQAVRAFHDDDTLAGKPLRLLIPGGLIALAAWG